MVSLNEAMSEPANNAFLSAAKTRVVANKMVKAFAADDLRRAIENLRGAAERIIKVEADTATSKHAVNLKKLKSMMAEMGLSAADIRGLGSAKAARRPGRPKKATAKRPPKKAQRKAPRWRPSIS